ncbi:hypothetical protein BGW42_004821 [Actinomortierella wolfii]|nr:hypothetical protein BGW42_004821 [Actinomortierella wolfii]KAG0227065.1 hypothetical protein BGW41_003987 [Actinomortierella wolfii]
MAPSRLLRLIVAISILNSLASTIHARLEQPQLSSGPSVQQLKRVEEDDGDKPADFTPITVEAVPYLPPPSDFPPDRWGNQIPNFSKVGYRKGHVPLPIAPVRVTLQPSNNETADDRERIQAAIDQVGSMPLQPFTLRDGSRVLLRGAVLLKAGVYRVRGSLILNKDGVVLRGEGNSDNGTVLTATGRFVHDFIHLNGLLDPATQGAPEYQATYGASRKMRPKNRYLTGDDYATDVSNEYIPVGTTRLPVQDIRPFRKGAQVVVERPATRKWIRMIGMDRIPLRPGDEGRTQQWDEKAFTLSFVRQVVGVQARDPKQQQQQQTPASRQKYATGGKNGGVHKVRYRNGAPAYDAFPDPPDNPADDTLKQPDQENRYENGHKDQNDQAGDDDRDEDDDDWDWWADEIDDGRYHDQYFPSHALLRRSASRGTESHSVRLPRADVVQQEGSTVDQPASKDHSSGQSPSDAITTHEKPERLDIKLPKLDTKEQEQAKPQASTPSETSAATADRKNVSGATKEQKGAEPAKAAPTPDGVERFSVVRHHVNSTGDYILEPDSKVDGSHGNSPPPPSTSSNSTRTVSEVEGEEVDDGSIRGYLELDIPLVMPLDPEFGGGYVYNFERRRRIPSDIGVENIALVSEYDQTNEEDENHAWYAAIIDQCQNCWLTDLTARHFVSGFKAASGSVQVTIQDCEVTEPISKPEEGGRRYMFMLQGQMGLVKRCRAREGRHDFITGAKTSGPNVFVDSEGLEANNDAGPHDRWTVGTLYDNIKSTEIHVRNRGWFGSGQGWAGAFQVLYHCNAEDPSYFQSPPGATNWVVAHNGSFWRTTMWFEGDDATYLQPDLKDLFPVNKVPRSLYWAQLVERSGGTQDDALRIENLVGAKGRNNYQSPTTSHNDNNDNNGE